MISDKRSILKWDKRFIKLAEHIASWSKDPSTKCGCVITDGNLLVSVGYNGFPKGIEDREEDYDNREVKYEKVIHAEMNAILHANRSLKGCTLYVYPFAPCARCATMIIQAGITRVVTLTPSAELIERWGNSTEICLRMFKEVEMELKYMPV
jgi:dCMP deaminase